MYLGIEISNTGSFKPAIKSVLLIKTKIYHIYNNTHQKVIFKLYESMVVPILCHMVVGYGPVLDDQN